MLSIIAHRGASALAPENTFAAFRRATEDEADGIEFDVRFSKDDVPVVFHDANLRRLTKLKHRVADVPAEELAAIDVGSWFNRAYPRRADDKFSAETIPTLAAALEFLKDYKGVLYVELKGGNARTPALAEAVCRIIENRRLPPNVVIKSFDLEALRTVKRISPNARTAALFEPKILTILRKKKRILEEAKKVNADEISIHYSMATENFVRRARENDFAVVIWTVNRRVWVKRAADFGIKAVITNRPAELLAEREKILAASKK